MDNNKQVEHKPDEFEIFTLSPHEDYNDDNWVSSAVQS